MAEGYEYIRLCGSEGEWWVEYQPTGGLPQEMGLGCEDEPGALDEVAELLDVDVDDVEVEYD